MARVTVEDCLKNVKNRFELVILAAKRARQLMRGKEAKVEWDNDKPTVVALREIAAGYTDMDHHETHDEHETMMIQETIIIKNPIELVEDDSDSDSEDNIDSGDLESEAHMHHANESEDSTAEDRDEE